MFFALQIVPTTAESLWDIFNKVRGGASQGDNVFPKVGNFCRYLSLQRIPGGGGPNSAVLISGTPRIHPSSAPQFTGFRLDASNPRFVLEDMEKGAIPLQDIYLVAEEDGGLNAVNVIIITDDSKDK